MKNQTKKSSIALFTVGFVFVLLLLSAQDVAAQRYLTEIRGSSEVKGIGQFADNLADFLKLAETIEQDNGAVSPAQLGRLEAAGKRIKDGTSNFRNNLKNLVANFKSKDQWNDELDSQINEVLGSRRIKAFFQRNGGRKVLTEADAAIGNLNAEIDAIIANARNQRGANLSGTDLFVQTSFASTTSAGKLRLKCAVLGVAIFGAELLRTKKTAENLDGIFDQSCGAGATATT